jgi:hypothetical protein
MIENYPIAPLTKHIDCIKDPRRHNIRHLLQDMLLIALCAMISGAESWTQVTEYGRSKQQWFSEFLLLPNGIPSHDTFGRVFAMLNPKDFENFFRQWVQEFAESIKGNTSGPASKRLLWSPVSAISMERYLRKKLTLSQAWKVTQLLSQNPSEPLGVLKTGCTGVWASPFARTSVAYEKTMLRKTWESCATWPSTLLNDENLVSIISTCDYPGRSHHSPMIFTRTRFLRRPSNSP